MKNIFTKTILILALLGLGFNDAKAQYVTIPNPGLRAYLSAQFPNCFSGNQMDTTCTEILSTTGLYLTDGPYPTIYNLNGIQYFKNLQTLDCSSNLIGSVEYLPASLKSFTCYNCQTNEFHSSDSLVYLDLSGCYMIGIPYLPNTLKELRFGGNYLGNNVQPGDPPYILPDSIEIFDCSSNDGLPSSVMPSLPSTLKWLKCSNNALDSLPPLPNKLKYLDISANLFTAVPNNLPDSLNTFYCNNNLIPGVISGLPDSIKEFACHFNQITSIASLPATLKNLYCQNNLLTNLPVLPPTLTNLTFQNNPLPYFVLPPNLVYLNCSNTTTSLLPVLPTTLKEMFCSNNLLQSLPNLPNTITRLYCDHNQLSTIPTLPNNLLQLQCNTNLLTSLPPLPNSLTHLYVDSNNISCLPLLPNLWTLNITENPITCVPNYISAMNAATLALPLCMDNDLINNPAGCDQSEGILGRIYKDNSGDCVYNNNEPQLKNIKVKFFNPINNQFGSTYSLPNGIYNYYINPGTYISTIDTLNKPYTANCLYPGLDTTVITTPVAPLAVNVNFGLACKPGIDLNVQSVARNGGLVFPGQQHVLRLMVGDASQWYGLNCANDTSGQVQITINGPVTYNGPAAGALTPTVNGNVYTYTIADFETIDNATDFQMLFTTDTTAQSGNQICVHTEVTPIIGDVNPSNNINDYCYIVHNSYDPNYKEVYPTDIPPMFQDWLTYTIHFQNLGTAPAINIRLLDTLDSNLDAATFEVINYSHYNTVTLMDGILDFRFPNILLPDSASNPSGSQGFVQYRIKPLANLPAGTQIENTAHIYFDFNPAVVTNTTVNNFTTAVGNATLKQATNLKIYPNPSAGIFTISSTANIEVYNIIGDLILSYNNATSIDLTAAPKGMYFVKLNGGRIEKLIKN